MRPIFTASEGRSSAGDDGGAIRISIRRVGARIVLCLALPLLAPAGCGSVSSAARVSEAGNSGDLAITDAAAASAAASASAAARDAAGVPVIEPAAGIPLAPGAGRDVLLRACTACHDLQALEAFKGYYDRTQWRALVLTMVEHGAVLDTPEVDVVTDYLVAHFGPSG